MSFPPPIENGGQGREQRTGRGRGHGEGRGQWQRRGNWRGRGSWRGRGRGNAGNGNRRPAVRSPQVSSQNDNQSGQQRITDMFEVVAGPYYGWKLYFQDESFSEGSLTVVKIRAVEEFLRQNPKMFPFGEIKERQAASIDVKMMTMDEDFAEAWPKFEEDLVESPEHTLACLGLALHQNVRTRMQRETEGVEENSENALPDVPIIHARPIGHQPVIQLQNLKTNCFGKLVSIRGTIIRVGSMKPAAIWMAYSCSTCGDVQTVRQPQGIFTQPTNCRTDGCRSRSFAPCRSSQFTQTVNWQTIRVQEIAVDEQREGGRVPRTVECELMEDLVDSAVPGDVVTITGIIRIHNSEESASRRKSASMFSQYLEAVSIVSNKGRGQSGGVDIEFNMKDYYAIQEIHSEPSLFRLLVHSLSPGIYGHELVKAGLLLGLVGGGASGSGARNDPHILVVGDPGLGKSHMLQASAAISPRGVYVCGNTSTASGLTVTLSREGHGDYALEAGALVLADQGCCCIDEFDKMSNQHQALLEAMEQQSISIAKAGVVCSLPARTSILSAANPVGGHYNRSKTVSENLRMGNALLSRFDLVFILMDKPNEHLDNLLTEHVLAAHSGLRKASDSSSANVSLRAGSEDYGIPLAERLKLYPGEHINTIPHSMLRKYLAYARKYVVPRISDEGKGILQEFYLQLRSKYQSPDSTPVTNRQLQSLIRLTEARAKLELREEATGQDAIDIVEMMRASLVDAFADEMGMMHFNRSINGSGMSKRGKAKRFLAVLQRRADAMARSTFSIPELREVASTVGVDGADVYDLLMSLNNQGCLLKKGPKIYQLLSVDH